MAKGNLFLGSGRGSVGDVTLSVLNGKQLSRRRARVVANPQSASQQLQRMVMSTVTGNAARLRSLISHSFQGVRAGAESYNYYNRVNLRLLRSQAVSGQIQGFRIKGAETFVPCDKMVLGKGILSAPSIEVTTNGINFDNAVLPSPFANEQSYLNALAQTFNAAPGDEIAILFVRQTTSIAAEYDGFYQFHCELATRRLVFMPWDDAFADQSLLGSNHSINSALLDYSIGGDGKPRTLDQGLHANAPGTNQLLLDIMTENTYRAGAVFISRPDGQGGWYNSNTSLVVNSDVYYKQDEIVAADIQGSYGPAAAQEPVSDYYLEQSVPETEVVAEPALKYAMAFAPAADVDWEYMVDGSELDGNTLELFRNEVYQMSFDAALNFVPSMVRVNGVFTEVDVNRIIKSDIPAGSSIYHFNLEDAVNTEREFTVDFFVQGGSKVTMNVIVHANS